MSSVAPTHIRVHSLSVFHSPSLTFPSSDLFSSICLQQSENKGSWHRCVIYVILRAASGPCVSLPCSGSADTVTQGRVTHAHKQEDVHTHTHMHKYTRLGRQSRWRGRVTSARPKRNSNRTPCCPCWHVLVCTVSECDTFVLISHSIFSIMHSFPLHCTYYRCNLSSECVISALSS